VTLPSVTADWTLEGAGEDASEPTGAPPVMSGNGTLFWHERASERSITVPAILAAAPVTATGRWRERGRMPLARR
jgi:hypothetical protein